VDRRVRVRRAVRVVVGCVGAAGMLGAWLLVACSSGTAPVAVTPAAPEAIAEPVPVAAPAASSAEFVAAAVSARPAEEAAPAACPAGMVLVEGTYCPEVTRTCLEEENDPTNHIRVCHRFEHHTECVGAAQPKRFCIDAYEYPNELGGHPPVLVSWYDGQAACQSEGKRLCRESEWVTACEGPEHTPFPYGWERDQTACNIDNVYIGPDIARMYASDRTVAEAELARLDQSVPSGAAERCVSGYGVHDLTGNFDEWVTRDGSPTASAKLGKSKWAGLKGGAWGHVRNACRPMTTSHPPQFAYYFISFRCCADAPGSPTEATPPAAFVPPKVITKALPPARRPARSPSAPGPSERKVGARRSK
jgi:formylglycine-generating enzyme